MYHVCPPRSRRCGAHKDRRTATECGPPPLLPDYDWRGVNEDKSVKLLMGDLKFQIWIGFRLNSRNSILNIGPNLDRWTDEQ